MTRVQDRVVIEGQKQGSFVVSAAGSAQSVPLSKGMYAVWASTGVIYIKVAHYRIPGSGGQLVVAPDRAQDVDATTGYIINAGNVEQIDVNEARCIGAFSTPGATVSYHRIGD